MTGYTQQEQEHISEMIDDIPGLFYGRDDNSWEDTVIGLHEMIMERRKRQPNDKRMAHQNDNRQNRPL